jgi:hypothetical protein
MKTSCFITLAFLCFCVHSSFAQTPGKFEFGANLGLNLATITTSQVTNTSHRVALNLAVSAEYYFSDRWGIKAKLIDDPKGWDDGFISTSSTTYATNFHLNYVTVPIMANWHFGKKRNWYLNFGPYISVLTGASETATGMDLKSYFNNTDFGFDLGIGVKIPVSDKARIFFEDDGEAGITDIFKPGNSGSAVYNSRSSINVGVDFNL